MVIRSPPANHKYPEPLIQRLIFPSILGYVAVVGIFQRFFSFVSFQSFKLFSIVSFVFIRYISDFIHIFCRVLYCSVYQVDPICIQRCHFLRQFLLARAFFWYHLSLFISRNNWYNLNRLTQQTDDRVVHIAQSIGST